MLPTYTSELPEYFDSDGLSKFFEGDNADKWIEAREMDFYIKSGAENADHAKAQINMLSHKVEKARSRWACISAKSQRAQKPGNVGRFSYSGYNEINTYQNLTTIQPKYERMVPISAGRDEGETIQRFTKRSRQRMLSKARRMNRENLPIPYFVTLTYHKNMQDFERAKKNLNAFFQRFRRVNKDFRYFWKMEPQKRGAIHFHLAFFEPTGFFPAVWSKLAANKKVEYMRMRVSSAWNEIAEPEYNETFTPVNESFNYKKDRNFHLAIGTNVRSVSNWKMFTAYVGKYMKKEVGRNPWGGMNVVNRVNVQSICGTKGIKINTDHVIQFPERYEFKVNPETGELKPPKISTGRWWGFSRNFDFEAIHSGLMDNEDLEKVNEFCNALNALTFRRITDTLIESAERANNELTGKRLKNKLNYLRNTYEAQKRRFEINKGKIRLGYSLQFEINADQAERCLKYVIMQRQKECPLLINYYKNKPG